jgi:hypothetical protein
MTEQGHHALAPLEQLQTIVKRWQFVTFFKQEPDDLLRKFLPDVEVCVDLAKGIKRVLSYTSQLGMDLA